MRGYLYQGCTRKYLNGNDGSEEEEEKRESGGSGIQLWIENRECLETFPEMGCVLNPVPGLGHFLFLGWLFGLGEGVGGGAFM